MNNNPFSIAFGKKPYQYIERELIYDEIMNDLNAEIIQNQCFMLSGVRGSGKTVMLNYLREQFKELDNWIVININPELDILESIASKLYEQGSIKRYFLKSSFNFSFKGFGFSLEGDIPVKSIETLLEKMMSIIDKHGKRVLITIDEIANTQNIKIFSHTFKNMVNDKQPIYLLATGLNENVYNLQNEKTLTFIYRAKKIEIGSLNQYAIARSYKTVLGLSEEVSIKCAAITDGYASAYQILGSILYKTNKKDIDDDVLFEFDKMLEDINYAKLWEDLSMNDKQFLYGFSTQKNNKAKLIIENSSISKESYPKYRERLIKRGIVISNAYGYLSLTLPRLINFIKRMKIIDNYY